MCINNPLGLSFSLHFVCVFDSRPADDMRQTEPTRRRSYFHFANSYLSFLAPSCSLCRSRCVSLSPQPHSSADRRLLAYLLSHNLTPSRVLEPSGLRPRLSFLFKLSFRFRTHICRAIVNITALQPKFGRRFWEIYERDISAIRVSNLQTDYIWSGRQLARATRV